MGVVSGWDWGLVGLSIQYWPSASVDVSVCVGISSSTRPTGLTGCPTMVDQV